MRARECELIVEVLTRIYQQRREERDVGGCLTKWCWNAGLWRRHGRSVHEAIPAYLWAKGDSHFLFFICHRLELNSQ